MSPNGPQSSDSDNSRRGMSPMPPQNGLLQQTMSHNQKSKVPMRPRREDEDLLGTDEGTDGGTVETLSRERAMSPEQSHVRAKSPAFNVPNRAVSPQQDGSGAPRPNMTGVVLNGLSARSESPNIDRSRPPPDAFYNAGSGSPTANGFANTRTTAGSTGNMTADLIRDLKIKEAEMDALKKKDAWMKMALGQAVRFGFVYPNIDSAEDEDLLTLNADMDSDDPGEQRIMEMALKYKQFKTHIHVRFLISPLKLSC
jgi:hypothetical protein